MFAAFMPCAASKSSRRAGKTADGWAAPATMQQAAFEEEVAPVKILRGSALQLSPSRREPPMVVGRCRIQLRLQKLLSKSFCRLRRAFERQGRVLKHSIARNESLAILWQRPSYSCVIY